MPTDDHRGAPPSEEQVRAAHRPVMLFALLLLAALWLSLTQPPWPLPLVPGLLAAGAVVAGVIGLLRLRRARAGGALSVLVVIGMGLAAAMVFTTVLQAVMWPAYSEAYACLERALTHQARETCLAALEERAQGMLLDLMP